MVNNITFCKDKYKTEDDFFNAIKSAIKLLLDADYIMTIRFDEPGLGICCIEYESADKYTGVPYPYWLTPEEQDLVEDYRYHNEEQE